VKKVVTFGEVMMRLTPRDNRLLIQADSFDAHFGGSEYNVAAGLVALGQRAMCVTRLPDNPLGKRALAEMRASGVEVPDDVMVPIGRLGLYFLEPGSSPRPNRVVYDRSESALATAGASEEFDWDGLLSDACWFHVSGITPALSSSPEGLSSRSLKRPV
jgi:2-dehydro-3-deoxygluconokinase